MEKGLQAKDNRKLLKQIDGDIRNVENKISKLLDLHLEDKIDKINYEEKYSELKKELQELKTEKRELDVVEDEEKTIKERIASFRKLFESKEPLIEFDREVFKTVVEEVVIGGYKEDGTLDPYMLTFIFKTGLTSKIDGHKQVGKTKENTASQKCTYQEDEPHRVRGRNTENLIVESDHKMANCQRKRYVVMKFFHDEEYIVFQDIGQGRRKKEVQDGIKVIIALVNNSIT